jgi:hypothetical protein
LALCLYEQNTAVSTLKFRANNCVAPALDFREAIKKSDDFPEEVAAVQFLTAVTSFCFERRTLHYAPFQQLVDRPVPEVIHRFSEHHS